MRLVFISDTHTYHKDIDLPKGDILIHAGDITFTGRYSDLEKFNTWLGKLDFEHKIVIAGNHDLTFEDKFFLRHMVQGNSERAQACLTNCIYLQDKAVSINGLKFYGSPWQPWFHDWAFNLERGDEMKEKWDKIPDDTDILITHGPPLGCGDKLKRNGELIGCWDLAEAIKRVKPLVHCCGHIHEGYGVEKLGETLCINASNCDLMYDLVNPPVVVDVMLGLNGKMKAVVKDWPGMKTIRKG